jgi:hypothetical protein
MNPLLSISSTKLPSMMSLARVIFDFGVRTESSTAWTPLISGIGRSRQILGNPAAAVADADGLLGVRIVE